MEQTFDWCGIIFTNAGILGPATHVLIQIDQIDTYQGKTGGVTRVALSRNPEAIIMHIIAWHHGCFHPRF